MADEYSNLIDRAIASASAYPEYAAITNYLIGQNKMPPLVIGDLEYPTEGAYVTPGITDTKHKGPTIELDRTYTANRTPQLLAATLIHELTHAAQSALYGQAKVSKDPQFVDAYRKLYGGGEGGQASRPGPQLAIKLNPDWYTEYKNYRATPWELQAYGVGNSATGRGNALRTPSHLDATLATEFQILLDLAVRAAKKEK